jgi:hypothetical protein
MRLSTKNNLKTLAIVVIAIFLYLWIGVRNDRDSIHHPENEEFVIEVAFNESIPVTNVTQKQFNARYGTTLRTITFKK